MMELNRGSACVERIAIADRSPYCGAGAIQLRHPLRPLRHQRLRRRVRKESAAGLWAAGRVAVPCGCCTSLRIRLLLIRSLHSLSCSAVVPSPGQ